MGNSCQRCDKNKLGKMLTLLIFIVNYLYEMYCALFSENSLTNKILNGIRLSLIFIANLFLLYFYDSRNSKMEPRENVEKREENREEIDAIREDETLVVLLSRLEHIEEKLKGLKTNGNKRAGKVLYNIEEALKPKENKIIK